MSRKSKRQMLTPDLTPLIDVVFLLLIFFMVSSVFKKEELSLLLSLPQTEQGEGKNKQQKSITIELTGQKLAYQGEKLEISQLSDKFKQLEKKTLINLRVDGQVVYDRLVRVLDMLQKNKLENISLITEKKLKKSK